MKTLILIAGLLLAPVLRAQAPVITSQTQDQLIEPGQTSTFSVNTTSNGLPVSYQWFKNGVALADGIAQGYTTDVATLADNGSVYFCVVTDAYASTASAAIVLNVIPPPSSFRMILNPSHRIIAPGVPANFTLGVANSTGETITLGCQTNIPNSVCLLSGNAIVQGDVDISILTGSTGTTSIRGLPIGLFLMVFVIGCAVSTGRRKLIPVALMVAAFVGGCNQMTPVPVPAQPTAQIFSFTITGTAGSITQSATGTVTIQQGK